MINTGKKKYFVHPRSSEPEFDQTNKATQSGTLAFNWLKTSGRDQQTTLKSTFRRLFKCRNGRVEDQKLKKILKILEFDGAGSNPDLIEHWERELHFFFLIIFNFFFYFFSDIKISLKKFANDTDNFHSLKFHEICNHFKEPQYAKLLPSRAAGFSLS